MKTPKKQNSTDAGSSDGEVKLEIMSSRLFTSWMAEQRVSLVFTSYQTGKLFFVGLNPADSKLSIFERTFNRCLGLHATPQTIYMSSLYQLIRFENILPKGQIYKGYDRLYVPQLCNITGDLDIHDVCVDKTGRVIFINTLFSCLATLDDTTSFISLWRPNFISKLAAEDRCHLNGLAMQDGEPKYVTAVADTDTNEGWRPHRKSGGIIIDVTTDEIVAKGLSMPHSPRMYHGKLYVLNSGTGYFGYIKISKGKDKKQLGEFVPLAFCQGYLRGLSFINEYAVVGLSKQRQNPNFSGLPLDENLKKKKCEPRCGIEIIHLQSGDILHSLQLEGIVEELYDVSVLPDVIRPMALGFKTDEIRHHVIVGENPEFGASNKSSASQ